MTWECDGNRNTIQVHHKQRGDGQHSGPSRKRSDTEIGVQLAIELVSKWVFIVYFHLGMLVLRVTSNGRGVG